MIRHLDPVVALLTMLAVLVAACTPAAPAPTPTAAAKPTAAPTAAPAATAATAPTKAAAPAATPAAPAKVDKITFAIASLSPLYWPIFVGEKKGLYYQKENIAVETLLVTGAPGQLQALVAKSAQISAIQKQATITAIEKGTINAHVVGNLARLTPYTIVAQKEIKNLAGLKGKRFGVSSVTGGEVAMLKKALATAGLKVEDVEMFGAGLPAARIAAMKAGALAGTFAVPPDDLVLADEGYSILATMGDVLGEFPFLSYTVTDEFAKANGDLLVRFMRATYLTTQWLFDPANKDEAIKVLVEKTKMEKRPAEASYDAYIKQSALSKDLVIGEKGMKAVFDLMVDVGDLKPPLPDWRKYLDLSYLEKATRQ